MSAGAVAEKPANRLAQDEWEFSHMLMHVAGCSSVLEIGSRYGESARRLAKAMGSGRIVCVDLGVDPFSPPGHDILTDLTKTVDDLCAQQFDARLVLGNSQDKRIVDIVRELGPFDFLFIDGDHSYDGVYRDFRNYGPMAKTVAFHDIVYGKPGFDGAKTLWTQIKYTRTRAEYVRSGLGIGVIFQTEEMR